MNEIIIKSLSVEACVGVPDEERATPQRLLIDVVIEPTVPFAELDDDIARTVDYDAAARRVSEVASDHPRRLIETLAADITEMLLQEFHAMSVTVEIRKFILPDTDYVAVRCMRRIF